MINYKNLKPKQFKAIKKSIELGKILIDDNEHLGIDDIYGYYPQGQIPGMLNIQSKYKVSKNVAKNSIFYAIAGHDGKIFGVNAFEGLIPNKEEREWIGREHITKGGKNGGRKSSISKGLTLWSPREKKDAYQLSLNQEYKTGSRINNQLIALALNIDHHNCKEVRNSTAVHSQLSRYKKSLVNKVA